MGHIIGIFLGQGLIVICIFKISKNKSKTRKWNILFLSNTKCAIPIPPSLLKYFFGQHTGKKILVGFICNAKVINTYFSIVILTQISTNNTYFIVVSTRFSILKILILLKLLVLQINQAKVSFCRKKSLQMHFWYYGLDYIVHLLVKWSVNF